MLLARSPQNGFSGHDRVFELLPVDFAYATGCSAINSVGDSSYLGTLCGE
jgi:hypothetical protein